MNHRLAELAHPEPTAPMAGKPRFPKMKTQFRKTLATLARRTVTRMGVTFPMAWRLWRKMRKT